MPISFLCGISFSALKRGQLCIERTDLRYAGLTWIIHERNGCFRQTFNNSETRMRIKRRKSWTGRTQWIYAQRLWHKEAHEVKWGRK